MDPQNTTLDELQDFCQKEDASVVFDNGALSGIFKKKEG